MGLLERGNGLLEWPRDLGIVWDFHSFLEKVLIEKNRMF